MSGSLLFWGFLALQPAESAAHKAKGVMLSFSGWLGVVTVAIQGGICADMKWILSIMPLREDPVNRHTSQSYFCNPT